MQTFRYLACGGTNTALNIGLQFIAYTYLFHKQDVHISGNFTMTVEVAAYIVAFCISFPIGFILSRHIVFPESNLHGRVQFFRYVMATVTFILLNYVMIKACAVALPMVHPTVSYTFVQVTIAVLSYISQRKFTFKTKEEEAYAD